MRTQIKSSVYFPGRRYDLSPRHVRLLTPDPEGLRQGLRAGERTFASTLVRIWRRTRSHRSGRSFVGVKTLKTIFSFFSQKSFFCSEEKFKLIRITRWTFFVIFWIFSLKSKKICFHKKTGRKTIRLKAANSFEKQFFLFFLQQLYFCFWLFCFRPF